jgi:hypothetical protein
MIFHRRFRLRSDRPDSVAAIIFPVAIVKKRPLDTTSERQLLFALLAAGRKAGLADLRAWRKAGLLPPLASHGTGAGRSYYWREPDIQAQTERVHDALQRHGRIDEALIAVWLAGFDVPLERLRRAWANRAKMSRGLKTRASVNSGGAASGPGSLLGMAMVYSPLLESSSLMGMAGEVELSEARDHLHRLLREPGLQMDASSETAGYLFLFILGLVRSGQGATLESANDDHTASRGKEQDHLPVAALH